MEIGLLQNRNFKYVIEKVKLINPLFNIEVQPFENSFGRYFHIFPDGKSHIVIQGKDGLPFELRKWGISLKDFDEVMLKVNEKFNFDHNSKHGKN